MQLHPYLVLSIEVDALKNWLSHMNGSLPTNKNKTSHQLLVEFRNSYCNDPQMWAHYDNFTSPEPTKTEKILYLYFYGGLGMNKIQKALGSSPNYVMRIIQEEKTIRHFQPHDVEGLIPAWEKLKQFIPEEIFIKYI